MSVAEGILLEKLRSNIETFPGCLVEIQTAMPYSISWIQREWSIAGESHARPLLVGAKISLLEACTAWAIGSNRGAASSLRVFMENAFSWLYYKDHPVEFRLVRSNSSDLMLPKSIQGYLKQIDGGFEKNYILLTKSMSRDMEYYYTKVSGFIHAHPNFADYKDKVEDAVVSAGRDPGFLNIVAMVDEFVSDNYAAYYRLSWDDIPKIVQETLIQRLGNKTKSFIE